MQLQIKPTPWSCLATSFAMALDIPLEKFFEYVGHDGSRIVTSLPEPGNRAGIHVQEAIDVCWLLGRTATPFELMPQSINRPGDPARLISFGEPFPNENWFRFNTHLASGRGVLECQGRKWGHAVAFDRGRIFDPDGHEHDYSRELLEARGLFMTRLWRIEA